MAKHLAHSESKKSKKSSFHIPKDLKNIGKEIRLPTSKHSKKEEMPEREFVQKDILQNAMLNKTLDRAFSLSDLSLTLLALVLLIVAVFLPTSGPVRLLSFLVPFLLASYNYLYEAFQEAFMGIVLGRELIITIAGLMALCAGAWIGACAIMICLKIGDLALSYVERCQSEKVSSLYTLRPEKANLSVGRAVQTVDASDLAAGNEIIVNAGETVPTDGVILDGSSLLDASALVGDSFRFPVAAGSLAVSGCANVSAPLRIRTERKQSDSVSAVLIRTAENAWMHKSAHERLLQRILAYVSPALVVLALLLAVVPSIMTGQWRVYLIRAAILLTASQMYSLAQSIKLCYDCAAACAAAQGISVKGHDVFESISKAETMVFDKTGTVTEGEYRVKEVFPRGVTEGQLLFLAGAAELHSAHPIARAIVAASGAYASEINAIEMNEIPGRGVSAMIDGRCVYVGNAALMEDHDIRCDTPSIPGSAIHVAVDGHYIGHIVLEDALRDCAFDVIEELRAEGVNTSVLLTGDVHSSARKIASSLNFDLVKAELTPEEKCRSVEYLMENRNANTTLAFVGDGVCDAEALRAATVGIVLGCIDRAEALESADAAILGRDFRRLPKLYSLARRAARSVQMNTIVCGAVKLLVIIFGAAGLCPLSIAVALQAAAILFEAFSARYILNASEEAAPMPRRFRRREKKAEIL